jgi:hypothetical protein
MAEEEQVEQQIQEVLRTETRAVSLSNRLFSPGGLFNQLAETEDQRRKMAGSVLFKRAQQRLLELQQQEAAEFSRSVRQTQATLPEGTYLIKLEQTERT